MTAVAVNDTYRQNNLKITDRPVHILFMNICFENDNKFDVSLKNKIPKAGKSRHIDFSGRSRSIKKLNSGMKQRIF
jgi:hypothetical protein